MSDGTPLEDAHPRSFRISPVDRFMDDFFALIPDEVLFLVMALLPSEDLRSIACVCRRTCAISRCADLKKIRWWTEGEKELEVQEDGWLITNHNAITTVRTDMGFSRGKHYWEITAHKCGENQRGIAVGVMHHSELEQGTQWTKHRIGYYLSEEGTVGVLLDLDNRMLYFLKDQELEKRYKYEVSKKQKLSVPKWHKNRLYPVVSVWGKGHTFSARFQMDLPDVSKYFFVL